MNIVRTHIVCNSLTLKSFVKVYETADGKYWKEMGSESGFGVRYVNVPKREFELWLENYKYETK